MTDDEMMTNAEKYQRALTEAERHRRRVTRIKAATRERLARVDNRRDEWTLDDLVGRDPLVKAAISDEQFYRAVAVSYGPGAIVEALGVIAARLDILTRTRV